MYDDVATTKMYPSNDTRWGELNITQEHIKDFLDKLLEMTNKTTNGMHNDDEEESCSYYCNGLVKEVSLGYKSIHGYISLVVRVF